MIHKSILIGLLLFFSSTGMGLGWSPDIFYIRKMGNAFFVGIQVGYLNKEIYPADSE